LQPENERHCGLLLAPFISEESAKICTDAGIGYADLAGNARLAFDTVFIETRSAGNAVTLCAAGGAGVAGAAARTATFVEGQRTGGVGASKSRLG